jgi:hypothetical protein
MDETHLHTSTPKPEDAVQETNQNQEDVNETNPKGLDT